jgi:hypothetical protein
MRTAGRGMQAQPGAVRGQGACRHTEARHRGSSHWYAWTPGKLCFSGDGSNQSLLCGLFERGRFILLECVFCSLNLTNAAARVEPPPGNNPPPNRTPLGTNPPPGPASASDAATSSNTSNPSPQAAPSQGQPQDDLGAQQRSIKKRGLSLGKGADNRRLSGEGMGMGMGRGGLRANGSQARDRDTTAAASKKAEGAHQPIVRETSARLPPPDAQPPLRHSRPSAETADSTSRDAATRLPQASVRRDETSTAMQHHVTRDSANRPATVATANHVRQTAVEECATRSPIDREKARSQSAREASQANGKPSERRHSEILRAFKPIGSQGSAYGESDGRSSQRSSQSDVSQSGTSGEPYSSRISQQPPADLWPASGAKDGSSSAGIAPARCGLPLFCLIRIADLRWPCAFLY